MSWDGHQRTGGGAVAGLQEQRTMGRLNDELAAIRAAGDAKRDPRATAVMHRATADLEGSGILDGVAAVGSVAPLFVRPTLDGATLRLASLLRKGPVILSFFRGRW